MFAKRIGKLSLILITLVALLLPAQSVLAAAGMKVATISLQEVLTKSKAGKTAQTQLEAKVQEFQDKFGKEQADLEEMGAEIEKKRSVWSRDILEQKERDYQMKTREFKLKTDDAQFELKQMEKKIMEPILKVLHELIADHGKKEKYVLILENTRKGLSSRTGLLYADESIDISDTILKLLDARLP